MSAGQAGWHRAGRASPAGSDGFSEAVQVVEVVVCGEELAAGGTDGGCLQSPANHPGHIGGVLQFIVGAALLRTSNEVGWFVHVLEEAEM